MKMRFTLLLICIQAISFELAAQFSSVTELNPLEARAFATREKQQAKVFSHDGKHWAILANSTGTHLWRLDGTTWTEVLKLATKNSMADYVLRGNLVHVLLFSGTSSQFLTIEYTKSSGTFNFWRGEKSASEIVLENGVDVASIDMDKAGRLWIASNGVSGEVNVRWSDSPYTNWSSPVTIASGVREDDLCAVIAMPQTNKIGVLWSNQKTKRWGFKTHKDGDNPNTWTSDEVPASQSALSLGSGMSDDHINMKVASDGTLYCAVKTGYNKIGYPLIALLVRRPSGEWDDLYEVSQTGTLPIIVLNEALGRIKIIYTAQTYGGDIVYKESSTSKISFCNQKETLISGKYNYATSTKQNYGTDVVILASNETQVVGVLATDSGTNPAEPMACDDSGEEEEAEKLFLVYPNPFTSSTTVSFILPEDQAYSLVLFDSKGAKISVLEEGSAVAGEVNNLSIDGSDLAKGLYLVRLQTEKTTKSLKLIYYR